MTSIQVLLLVALITMASASAPTIDQDGWSPVASSRIVQLPDDWQRPGSDTFQERIDVERPPFRRIPRPSPPPVPTIPTSPILPPSATSGPTSTDLLPQEPEDQVANEEAVGKDEVEEEEEQDFPEAHQPGSTFGLKHVAQQDDQPALIVYPSGSLPDFYINEQQQHHQHQQPKLPEVPEVPRPPSLPRRPPTQQSPPIRRPPQPPPPPPPQVPQPGLRLRPYSPAPVPPPPPPPPPPPQQSQPQPPPPPSSDPFSPAHHPTAPVAPEDPEAFARNAPSVQSAQPFQGLPYRSQPRPPPVRSSEENGGILAGIGSGLTGIKCAAEEWAAESKLKDETFVRQQLDCVMDRGPCDDFGLRIKRLAPDVMRGLCPHPCDQCVKGKIQKVMSFIARNYPKQWNEIVREFGRRPQHSLAGDRQRRRDRRRRR